VLGRSARLANHRQHLVERAGELLGESRRVARRFGFPSGLPRDEEEAATRRGDQAVVPSLRLAERLRVHDLEAHDTRAPPSMTMASPFLPAALSRQSASASSATSSAVTSRFCPVVASTAASASSRGSPVRRWTFASV